MERTASLDIIILAGVAFLGRRLLRERRLPVATMWLLPLLMLGIGSTQRAVWLGGARPDILLSAAVAGGLAGIAVGVLVYVRAERPAGAIVVRGTPLSVLLWPGTVALYILARRALAGGDPLATGDPLDIAFLVFVAAVVAAERGCLYWQYRRDPGGRAGGAPHAGPRAG